ncbi:energy transducer TonB [Uliginosibacterium paludis]|uniref:Energy transducer TonB n=1 Tax=Uliginosibacterium paludis TaxID=1615952 RepID=A0ABV2CNC0_9RHOO
MEHTFQRPEPGKWASAVFSFAMHALLLGALFWGVQWQSRPPEPVSVELVRAMPASTPPTVERQPEPEARVETPPPRPEPKPVEEKAPEPRPAPKPDIALKEPEKKKPEPKREPPKPEPEKKVEKKPEPKPEPKPVEKKEEPKPPMSDLDKMLARENQRVREVKNRAIQDQQTADLNAKLDAAANAASMGRAQADWVHRISQKVRSNLILPPGTTGNPKLVFRLQILPTGEILGEPKLVSNTGNAALEEAVRRAILKSSPLPKPEKNEVFQRDLNFNFFPMQND